MDLTIINRQGHPISGQELAQVLLDGVPVPSVLDPEQLRGATDLGPPRLVGQL